MKRKAFVLLGVLVMATAALIWAGAPDASAQSAQKPVVRAVLFHAEGCSHCQTVIDKVLPPLQLKHGDQLQIAMIEVSGKENYDYFRQIEESAKLPPERKGVPALFIADQILVGDQEIPQKLPGLIQKGLASGGIDYPALPGLAEQAAAGRGRRGRVLGRHAMSHADSSTAGVGVQPGQVAGGQCGEHNWGERTGQRASLQRLRAGDGHCGVSGVHPWSTRWWRR